MFVPMQRHLPDRQAQLRRQHPLGDAFGQLGEFVVVGELAIAIGGSLGEVIVEESGLGVTDVKVTTCEGSVKSRDAYCGEERTWAREGNG